MSSTKDTLPVYSVGWPTKVPLNIYHEIYSEYGSQLDFNNACRKACFAVEML